MEFTLVIIKGTKTYSRKIIGMANAFNSYFESKDMFGEYFQIKLIRNGKTVIDSYNKD